MFVIPILLLGSVCVRKYRNEITCCMITSVPAFFAMGTFDETNDYRQEKDRKMKERMAWEEQEKRHKNQEAQSALESAW